MMRRVSVVIVTVASLLMVGTGAMAATAPEETIAQIDLRGYYVDAGVDVDINELERLVASIPDGPEAVYFVALDEDPVEGTDLFATEVLGRIAAEGTVVVVSPGEIGVRSTEYGDEQLNGAIDDSLDAFDRAYADGFAAFADALVGLPVQAAAAADPGAGGGGFVFLLIIAAIGALIFFMVRRSKKSQEQAFADSIEETKAEVRGQLGDVADDILELEDEVLLSDNSQAKDLYAAGSAAYAEFEEKLEAATSPKELHDLVEGLDMTQWQLEAAEALIDGQVLPPKPEEHGEHQPEPPAQPAQPGPRPSRSDLPPDLQMRRERGQRIPDGGSRPRRRSGGWLGGLGTAATVLRGLQQASGGRRSRSRSRVSNSGGRGSGINLPNLGGSRSTRRSSRSSSRSPRPSTRSGSRTMRGRARRKR